MTEKQRPTKSAAGVGYSLVTICVMSTLLGGWEALCLAIGAVAFCIFFMGWLIENGRL